MFRTKKWMLANTGQNEWERLFGAAEMSADNFLIPPFTFPQFSPSDLWPQTGNGTDDSGNGTLGYDK
jgi:hypothetical protein